MQLVTPEDIVVTNTFENDRKVSFTIVAWAVQ